MIGHDSQIVALSFQRTEASIGRGSDDGAVDIWDLKTGPKARLQAHPNG